MDLPHWQDAPPNARRREDGALFRLGDLVKVRGEDVHGEIVRWDLGRAVVLDDDAGEWTNPYLGEDGTLVYSLEDLVKW